MIPPPQNNHNFNNLTITHNTRIKPKSNYNQRTLIEQMQKKSHLCHNKQNLRHNSIRI